MSAKRFEGRNLDEAISSAASAFGVEAYRLNYHIVMQKRGFLGGTKRVVIEAEPGTGVREDLLVEETAEAESAPVTPRVQTPRPEKRSTEIGREQAEGSRGRRRSGRGQGGRPDREKRAEMRTDDRVDDTPAENEDIPVQTEQSEAERTIAAWCDELCRLTGLDLVVRTSEFAEEIDVVFHGRDRRVLTGKGGELLDSFQVLANKAFVGRAIEKPIEFDAGGFKQKRMEELGEKALGIAETVKREGRERLLPAMTPIERRIVHMTLRDIEGVETVSRGTGFLKRVAIVPRPAGHSGGGAGE